MKSKLTILLLSIFGCSVISNAQYFEDAYRFSNTNYSLGSTARMQAVGGAQIALGGDISSAVSNPAGLGFFNKSVFVFSPSLDFISADTDYSIIRPDEVINAPGSDLTFRNNFNFSNIGTVINFGKGRFTDDKFKGGSLAISLSRNNTYHLSRTYEGENGFNSIVDNILQGAGSKSLNELSELEYAAFDQFIINQYEDDQGIFYTSNVGGFPIQRETIKERGSHYQLNMAWGGNYDDRLYFGGGMGVQILNYKQNRSYEEFDFLQDGSDMDSLNAIFIDDEIRTRGAGVNFNAGAIYRPASFLTVGVSYTSPSFLSLDEESFIDLEADWDPGSTFTEEVDGETTTYDLANIDPYRSNLFVNTYRLRTPSKVGLGASMFIGKSGFLSGDLEFVNYGNAKLNSDDFSTSQDNDDIKSAYESVVNIRVGGEYRFDSFRLRAGYAYFPDPFKDTNLQDRTNITFGFGYRTFDYFLDFAVVSSISQQQAVPYFLDPETVPEDFAGQPVATSDIQNTTVTVTFGFNF
ncbi:Outer membrane protein transport protein (OMPP1/FadL/TodX) [Ekhidna lutea]|uniref:Outer membrane protein transport protein (OMPP1/FadL/TodX) n=1 Tax=Ekhidna lutea TaxID=447679 RepID=A0A239IVJ4_EKHLU|nr:outer membrane protein transport protein [Ekhidna lutea]SNS97023.1 Outer membrane protein transport protein (OMPP1/FadL/TodX) [Ekhidna lutea]